MVGYTHQRNASEQRLTGIIDGSLTLGAGIGIGVVGLEYMKTLTNNIMLYGIDMTLFDNSHRADLTPITGAFKNAALGTLYVTPYIAAAVIVGLGATFVYYGTKRLAGRASQEQALED